MRHCNMIMDAKVNFKTEFEFVNCNAIVNLILSGVHHS